MFGSPSQLVVVVLTGSFVLGCGPIYTPPHERSGKDETVEPVTPATPGPVDEDAPEAFTTTDSGLKYRVRRRGNGRTPSPTDTIEVHYEGTLDDGTIFDSSYPRGKTAEFQLHSVIAGWTEGLQFCEEGGMIELEIPPELGYGDSGTGYIVPGGATLHFLVELKTIR